MSRPGFLSEVSWLQVTVSALAAVTAAWIASSLGVAGTLIGAALGSSVVTISSAFYGRTLDKGKTLIVQTASGTIVQAPVDDGDIGEAFEKVEEAEGSPVTGAQVVDDADGDAPRRLHWKTIGATTAIVLAISLGAMGTYELVTGESYGVRSDNARIGNPLGGSHDSQGDDPAPDDSPTPEPTAATTTPAPAATTPVPTSTTPAPTASTPAPTPTATATTPTPTPTATATPTRPAE